MAQRKTASERSEMKRGLVRVIGFLTFVGIRIAHYADSTRASKVTCTASAERTIDITRPLDTPWPATSPTATAMRPSSSASTS